MYNQPDGHGFVEATQQYTFEPRPELDGQYLYCVYQQVLKLYLPTLCTIPIWDLSSAPFKLNQTDLKCSFTDLQEDGEGRELYTSEVNIELVSHYLAVSEATPLVEAAQTGQDLDIRLADGYGYYHY